MNKVYFTKIKGIIDRRILINYKLDPIVAKNLLPTPFTPIVHNGYASVGVCLIKLKQTRPLFFPKFIGIKSENAAHRFAIQWEDQGETKKGVYIPRRDTSLILNSIFGGRLFPGVHYTSDFNVNEYEKNYEISFRNKKDRTYLKINCNEGSEFPKNSMFSSLEEASNFFKKGSIGYSLTRCSRNFQSLEFKTDNWKVKPLHVEKIDSSYFNNQKLFPTGSIEFDHALIMKNIEHYWIAGKSFGR